MTWLISDLVKLKRTSGLHASANELRHARLQAFRNTNAMAVHARDVGTGPAHAGDESHPRPGRTLPRRRSESLPGRGRLESIASRVDKLFPFHVLLILASAISPLDRLLFVSVTLNSRPIDGILGGPTDTIGMNKFGAVTLGCGSTAPLEAFSRPARTDCRWRVSRYRQASVSRK